MQIIYIDMHKIADPKPSTVVGAPIMLRGFAANCPSNAAWAWGKTNYANLDDGCNEPLEGWRDVKELAIIVTRYNSITVGQYDT